tara:strand:- start:925 stop:1953 length:1029 start_codon:yes stop_codon:yes gene_type:complete
MDFDGLAKVCETLDLDFSREYGEGSRRGAHISIACPLALKTHSDPKDDNLSCSVKLDPDGPSVAKCHSITCGFEGSLIRLVEEATAMRPRNRAYIKLLTWLDKHEKVDVSAKCVRILTRIRKKDTKRAAVYSREKTNERDVLTETKLSRFNPAFESYAEGRGITENGAKAWGLTYDAKRSRLVFPVRRGDGKLVGMTGRDVTGEKNPKWFNYSGLNKARYLFGGWLMKPELPVILTEGPIDAVRVWQALEGVNAVACMGSGLSKEHALTIKNMRPTMVYLFPDGDAAGKAMAQKAAKMLKPLVMRLMKTPKGEDPASLKPAAVKALMAEAMPILGNVRWSPS